MQTVYYEGSDTYQYLSQLSLIDEAETQPYSSQTPLSDLLPASDQVTPSPKQNASRLYTVEVDATFLNPFFRHPFHLSWACTCLIGLMLFLPNWTVSWKLFGCLALVWALALRLLFPLRIVSLDETDMPSSPCHIAKTLRLLQKLRKLSVQFSFSRAGQKHFRILLKSIRQICGQVLNPQQEATYTTPVWVHSYINQIISKINSKLVDSSFDAQCKVSQVMLKIATRIFMEYQYLAVYHKLLKYERILRARLEGLLANQTPDTDSTPGLTAPLHSHLLQIQCAHLLQEQIANKQEAAWLNDVNKTILNLIKIQLLQKQESQFLSIPTKAFPQTIQSLKKDENQISEPTGLSRQPLYLEITTFGERRLVENEQIRYRVENLKGRLDQIIEAKIKVEQSCEDMQIKSWKQTQKDDRNLERRVEGFGNMFGLIKKQRMQEFYIG